jgi:hypothetical protein
MATAAAGRPFDRDLFCKLVRLMDSANEFERNRATGQAVQMCAARGLRFCDMAADVFGSGRERIAELETALKKAERCGETLARELEKYRACERWCHSCEIMRRVVAVVIGGAILGGWFHWFPPQKVAPKQTGYGALFAAAPVVFLVCRWAVIQFKRRNHWYSFRDNDVFRAVARAWNRSLERFFIES